LDVFGIGGKTCGIREVYIVAALKRDDPVTSGRHIGVGEISRVAAVDGDYGRKRW
jgi:hypothetical protein